MNTEIQKDEVAEAFNEYQDSILMIASVAGVSVERIGKALRTLCDELEKSNERIKKILEPLQNTQQEDTVWLKRQIKHCKNPLEEKALRKRLNEATRNSRRRKKIGSRSV